MTYIIVFAIGYCVGAWVEKKVSKKSEKKVTKQPEREYYVQCSVCGYEVVTPMEPSFITEMTQGGVDWQVNSRYSKFRFICPACQDK